MVSSGNKSERVNAAGNRDDVCANNMKTPLSEEGCSGASGRTTHTRNDNLSAHSLTPICLEVSRLGAHLQEECKRKAK